MVCFQTKNPNLGKFVMVLDWKMFIYFMTIWNIDMIRNIGMTFGYFISLGTFCVHLVHFSGFGIMYVPRKIWQPLLHNATESYASVIQTLIEVGRA
jgi:hypothetical protein